MFSISFSRNYDDGTLKLMQRMSDQNRYVVYLRAVGLRSRHYEYSKGQNKRIKGRFRRATFTSSQ